MRLRESTLPFVAGPLLTRPVLTLKTGRRNSRRTDARMPPSISAPLKERSSLKANGATAT